MLLSFAYLAFSAVLQLLATNRRSEFAEDVGSRGALATARPFAEVIPRFVGNSPAERVLRLTEKPGCANLSRASLEVGEHRARFFESRAEALESV
jgi:hypothetical protein